MVKGEFLDEVLRLLTGGNYSVSEFKFTRNDVAMHLNGAIGMLVKNNFWENYKLGDKGAIDAGFFQTFEVPVLYSESRKQYYSTLPVMPLALERGLGICEITPLQSQRDAFVPLIIGDAGLYKGLDSENLFGEIGFRQEGKKVWYQGINDVQDDITMVLMNIVGSTLDIAMDDELPLPSDYYIQAQQIVIQEMTRGLIKQDTQQDSNPTFR